MRTTIANVHVPVLQRLLESVSLGVEAVNALPGVELKMKDHHSPWLAAGGAAAAAALVMAGDSPTLPFEVSASLCMPPVMPLNSGEVKAATRAIEVRE
jgi:hypothetical protein